MENKKQFLARNVPQVTFIKLIIFLLFALGVGIIIGFNYGVSITIHKFVDVASRFIDIDYETVEAALNAYKSHIANCYPINITN